MQQSRKCLLLLWGMILLIFGEGTEEGILEEQETSTAKKTVTEHPKIIPVYYFKGFGGGSMQFPATTPENCLLLVFKQKHKKYFTHVALYYEGILHYSTEDYENRVSALPNGLFIIKNLRSSDEGEYRIVAARGYIIAKMYLEVVAPTTTEPPEVDKSTPFFQTDVTLSHERNFLAILLPVLTIIVAVIGVIFLAIKYCDKNGSADLEETGNICRLPEITNGLPLILNNTEESGGPSKNEVLMKLFPRLNEAMVNGQLRGCSDGLMNERPAGMTGHTACPKESTPGSHSPSLNEVTVKHTSSGKKELTTSGHSLRLKDAILNGHALGMKDAALHGYPPGLNEALLNGPHFDLRDALLNGHALRLKDALICNNLLGVSEAALNQQPIDMIDTVPNDKSPSLKDALLNGNSPSLKGDILRLCSPTLKEASLSGHSLSLKEPLIRGRSPSIKEAAISRRSSSIKEAVIIGATPGQKDVVLNGRSSSTKEALFNGQCPSLKETVMHRHALDLKDVAPNSRSQSVKDAVLNSRSSSQKEQPRNGPSPSLKEAVQNGCSLGKKGVTLSGHVFGLKEAVLKCHALRLKEAEKNGFFKGQKEVASDSPGQYPKEAMIYGPSAGLKKEGLNENASEINESDISVQPQVPSLSASDGGNPEQKTPLTRPTCLMLKETTLSDQSTKLSEFTKGHPPGLKEVLVNGYYLWQREEMLSRFPYGQKRVVLNNPYVGFVQVDSIPLN